MNDTQKGLIAAKEHAELLLHTANVMIIELDPQGRITLFNRMAEEITGYTKEEVAGRNWFELIVPRDRFPEVWKTFESITGAKPVPVFENPILTKFGEVRHILWQNSEIKENGATTGTLSFGIDVTTRKITEDRLQQALKEKELLLREVHHRVKNNLQILSSLFYLKAQNVTDPVVRELLREGQNRLLSMSLVHDHLYKTDSVQRIDFAEYARNLTQAISDSHSTPLVTVRLDAQPLYMNIDTAATCGLILNELLTNSFKHAFPDGKGGTIDIKFSVQPPSGENPEKAVLRVSDSGGGPKKPIDLATSPGLGLRLVAMLARQLGGDFTIQKKGNTEFVVSFTPQRDS